MKPTHLLALVLLAACWFIPQNARAAHSYDSCTGFIDTVPATVSTQGVWCLRSHLSTAITFGAAIRITANNVTIDCNGFRLGGLAAGAASQAAGVSSSAAQNVAVRNCSIRGFYRGVQLDQGTGHLVEDNRLDNMLFTGISVCCERDNVIRRNEIRDTTGSTVASSATGISGTANIVENNIRSVTARGSGLARGINAAGMGAVIRDNQISEVSSVASGSSTAVGIYADAGAQTIKGNTVSLLLAINEGAAIGIHATSASAQIVGNQLGSSEIGTFGIRGSAANTVCKDNTAVNFTTPFSSCEASEGNIAPP